MNQETEATINRLMADKKMLVELVDYFVKENNRLKQVLQQIAEEGSGHGQALAYAALTDMLLYVQMTPKSGG